MTPPPVGSDLLLEALCYASLGWPVLPLQSPTPEGGCSCGKASCSKPGKHPRTLHGLNDATTAKATISRWWSQWPEANIGIAIPEGILEDFDRLFGAFDLGSLWGRKRDSRRRNR